MSKIELNSMRLLVSLKYLSSTLIFGNNMQHDDIVFHHLCNLKQTLKLIKIIDLFILFIWCSP